MAPIADNTALARYDMNKEQSSRPGKYTELRETAGHFPSAMSPARSDKGFTASHLIELYLVFFLKKTDFLFNQQPRR